jgi:hypothetical protein
MATVTRMICNQRDTVLNVEGLLDPKRYDDKLAVNAERRQCGCEARRPHLAPFVDRMSAATRLRNWIGWSAEHERSEVAATCSSRCSARAKRISRIALETLARYECRRFP